MDDRIMSYPPLALLFTGAFLAVIAGATLAIIRLAIPEENGSHNFDKNGQIV